MNLFQRILNYFRFITNLKLSKQFLFTYFRTLYNDFDAVQEISNLGSGENLDQISLKSGNNLGSRWNARYFLPILVNLYFFTDTLFINWKADFRYENIGDSDDLIDRKIFSTNVSHEADVAFPFITLWSFGIFFCHCFRIWFTGTVARCMHSLEVMERAKRYFKMEKVFLVILMAMGKWH